MAFMNDRIIFYHVPKTGGRWVQSALRGKVGRAHRRYPQRELEIITFPARLPIGPWLVPRQHQTPETIPRNDRRCRFEFCFVRRPVEWLESFWAYRVRTKNLDLRFPLDWLWDEDFARFVSNVLQAFPQGFITLLVQCYVGRSGNRLDFVGRQESLEEDLAKALELAGEAPVSPERLALIGRRNEASAEYRERLTLSESMRRKIETSERWLLEAFYA